MKKIKFISAVWVFLLIAGLCSAGSVFAGQKARTLEDKIISSTFKTLVKAYVATADLDKLKQDGINKINKMDNDKFNRRYANIYNKVRDLPDNLKTEYKVTEHKRRKEAIEDIKSLHKQKIYKAIDSIPDKIIADNFRQYLSEKREELQKSNLAEQVNKIWNKIIQKMEKDKPKSG